MFDQPQKEHEWLSALQGQWTSVMECVMKPGDEPMKIEAPTTVTFLGGLWAMIESEGHGPDGKPWKTILTVGYSPKAGAYVGTFLGSMMTFLWSYTGSVDASGRKLVLDTEGPKMDGSNSTAKYKETIEIIDPNHWTFSSRILTDDGSWQQVMNTDYYRK